MHTHSETWMELDRLGTLPTPYRATHAFTGDYVDDFHRAISELPLQGGMTIEMKTRRWFGRVIPGWLQPADALKLYEMAYFATGDVLELGSYQGLSTSIMARAIRNGGHHGHIESVDLSPRCATATKRLMKGLGLADLVDVHTGDASELAREFKSQARRFDFVFVDHSHAYRPVFEVCAELAALTKPGGTCLFHDFNDPRNAAPDDDDYGVYQAVRDGLPNDLFDFMGIYGCAALYRRRED